MEWRPRSECDLRRVRKEREQNIETLADELQFEHDFGSAQETPPASKTTSRSESDGPHKD